MGTRIEQVRPTFKYALEPMLSQPTKDLSKCEVIDKTVWGYHTWSLLVGSAFVVSSCCVGSYSMSITFGWIAFGFLIFYCIAMLGRAWFLRMSVSCSCCSGL